MTHMPKEKIGPERITVMRTSGACLCAGRRLHGGVAVWSEGVRGCFLRKSARFADASPATRNRPRDHLIATKLYSQMLSRRSRGWGLELAPMSARWLRAV